MATAASSPVFCSVLALGNCHHRRASVVVTGSSPPPRPTLASHLAAWYRGRVHSHLLRENLKDSDQSSLAGSGRERRCRCSASDEPPESPSTSSESPASLLEDGNAEAVRRESRRVRGAGPKREADSTDWISSSLTRRFGLAGGLAWAGFLAFGVVSEQIKTRTEVARESQGTRDVTNAAEVVLGDGVRFVDLRSGGGASPVKGDLVLLDVKGRVPRTGEVFLDGKRPVAFVFGVRPYPKGICAELESALESMKTGGKRRVTMPAALCFGDAGEDMGNGVLVPGNEDLEFEVELQKVSIAPS